MQDMEFTVEHGKLYMLQTRNGKRTAKAALKIACDLVDEGMRTEEEAVAMIDPRNLDSLLHPQFDAAALKAATPLAKALGASPGAAWNIPMKRSFFGKWQKTLPVISMPRNGCMSFPMLSLIHIFRYGVCLIHISVPNVDGPRRSLQMAINDAGIPLEEIQYINAHATSTPVGDLNEAKAIAEVFGNHRPYVTSTKSQTGHEMWMAGASEVIYSIFMMNNGFIAPNLNFEEPDEASALLNIPSRRIETEFDTFLSNSFRFGGTNSSLIIRKFKENN